MVLAMALDLDVAQHDDIVIALHILEGAREILHRIFRIAGEPFPVGVDDALGRVDHAFALGVVPGPGNERANRLFGFLAGGTLDFVSARKTVLGCYGVHGQYVLPSLRDEGRAGA